MTSEFATKFKLGDEKAIEVIRSFIERKLLKSQVDYDYFNDVRTYKSIWIVSRLGKILDNQLELISILFSDEGGLALAREEYYPIGVIAAWESEYACLDYIHQLQLAHERKVRQLEFCLKEQSAQFSFQHL